MPAVRQCSKRLFSASGASEGLSQPDVDLERVVGVVTRTPLQWYGHVQPDRPDRRVVAYSYACPGFELAVERAQVGTDVARVQESRGTEIRAEALPEFDRPRVDRGASLRVPVGEQR